MRTSFPLEAARPLLTLLKEIWETKALMACLFMAIHYGFPHGFRGLWIAMTAKSETPTMSLQQRSYAFILVSALTSQLLAIWSIWIWFCKAQAASSSPWKDLNMFDIFHSLDAETPLRGLHFIFSRFGRDRRRISRLYPWHFKHSLVMTYYTLIIFCVTKIWGPSYLLISLHLCVQYDTYWLLYRQAAAALGSYKRSSRMELNYRQKPWFAQAALIQVVVYGLAFALLLNDHLSATFVMCVIPVTSFGTILLFILHGYTPDYVNSTPTVYVYDSDEFCTVCESAWMGSGGIGSSEVAHHPTKNSLMKSAKSGCRICTAVWQHASRIPEDFVKTLKFWEPFTQLSNSGFTTVRCNGIHTDFEFKKGKGEFVTFLSDILKGRPLNGWLETFRKT
jgi:hypothetical protein